MKNFVKIFALMIVVFIALSMFYNPISDWSFVLSQTPYQLVIAIMPLVAYAAGAAVAIFFLYKVTKVFF